MGRPKGSRNVNGRCNRSEKNIRRLHARGLQTGDIGALVGVTAETIRRFLLILGLVPNRVNRRGERNSAWRGGRIVDRYGYVLLHRPQHPHANAGGYVRAHRLVMERVLGRLLDRSEVVDHVNGKPADNRPSNLRLFATNADHLRATLAGRCPRWSDAGKERMRQGVIRGNKSRHHQRKDDASGCM